jgi:hypothetical protein
MADNIRNEVVTIHRSQEMLKMLASLHVDIFLLLIVSLKNTGTEFLLALTAHQTPTFTGWLHQLCCRSCIRLSHSSLWARRFSDFLGVCSSLASTRMSCNFSVSTRRLCLCFLLINSPVVLSLFTKLWIVCLLELFRHEIYVQFFAYTF